MDICNYKKVEINACPICESVSLEPLFEEVKKYVLNDCTCVCEQQYAICKDCCFVFTKDPLRDDSLSDYYENDSQERSERATNDEKVHMQAQFDFLLWNGVDVRSKSVLEIGAGNGTFLDLLRTKGADADRLYYDELSAGSIEILNRKNFKIISVEEVRSSESQRPNMDLVVMNHTLEHLVQPLGKLKKIYNILSEDGYLYIEVPDFTYDGRNTDNVIFQHVNFFSADTLQRLLEKAGFTVVAVQNDFDGEYTACKKNIVRILANKNNTNKVHVNNRGLTYLGGKPETWIECRAGFRSRELKRKSIYKEIDEYLSNESKLEKYNKTGVRVAFWTARAETCECLQSITRGSYSIIAIFDRNKIHWHKTMFDVEILDPESLSQMDITHIIIPNEGYETEIKRGLSDAAFAGEVKGWSDFRSVN
jgi:SAM-dependent methyltransferase